MLCIGLHFNIKLIDGLRWRNQVGIYSKSQINPIQCLSDNETEERSVGIVICAKTNPRPVLA